MVIAQVQSVQGACRTNKNEGYHGSYFLYEFCKLREGEFVDFAPNKDLYGDLVGRDRYKVKDHEIKIMGIS